MGVATGIVQEFQFGMNWSEYSRFVGDVFGAPLAIEALLAFFLESTFLGLWIFGWDKLPKKAHLASIWLVAIGSNISALWILIANSFMQQPMGYALRNGRAEMESFLALITNPHVFVQFPHVIAGAMATAAFFVLGISAWHLLRARDEETKDAFRRSFHFGAVYAFVATVAVMVVGHTQAQYMIRVQPMKMAAAEALWESENPAAMSLFTWGNERDRKDVWAIRVPGLLSFLAYNRFEGEVRGIKEIQAEYEAKYGPGDYVPPVKWSYWNFRAMAGAGMAMLFLAAWALLAVLRGTIERSPRLLALLVPAIAAPLRRQQRRLALHRDGPGPLDRVRGDEDRERGLAQRHRGRGALLARRLHAPLRGADGRQHLPARQVREGRSPPARARRGALRRPMRREHREKERPWTSTPSGSC